MFSSKHNTIFDIRLVKNSKYLEDYKLYVSKQHILIKLSNGQEEYKCRWNQIMIAFGAYKDATFDVSLGHARRFRVLAGTRRTRADEERSCAHGQAEGRR